MPRHISKEKLTAYILGELDPREHAKIEKLIESDEELRKTADELKDAATLAHATFQDIHEHTLAEEQRTKVLAGPAADKIENAKVQPTRWTGYRLVFAGSLAAASITVIALFVSAPRLGPKPEIIGQLHPVETKDSGGDALVSTDNLKKTSDSSESSVEHKSYRTLASTEQSGEDDVEAAAKPADTIITVATATESKRDKQPDQAASVSVPVSEGRIFLEESPSPTSVVAFFEGVERNKVATPQITSETLPAQVADVLSRGLEAQKNKADDFQVGFSVARARAVSVLPDQLQSLGHIGGPDSGATVGGAFFEGASVPAAQGGNGFGGGRFGGGGAFGGGAAIDMDRDSFNGVRFGVRLKSVSASSELVLGEPVDVNSFAWQMADVPDGSIPPELRQNFINDPNLNHQPGMSAEAYAPIVDNPFMAVSDSPLSTFSIDVDTASYSNVRRYLNQATLPPKDAVRIEELINYFSYDYEPPTDDQPFAADMIVAECPWAPDHRLARIGIKGWEVPDEERPAANLVFLVDVSGSMQPQNKLPLLLEGMKMLTRKLGENDRVAIVVYAGATGLALPSTTGDQQATILSALNNLKAGGSTNGGAGIELAYKTAVKNFIKGGINRVVLATDGDFNVGVTNEGDLVNLIEKSAETGVFLTVLGFGMGNIKDSALEKLADQGNGNYAYIDTLGEAHKVLVEEMGSTLITIAKDVKIQVEFNPAKVASYRLIGYENRVMAAQDFNDDTKDAGEIGSGHTITALYEIVPVGTPSPAPSVDPLKYQQKLQLSQAAASDELLTLKLRYKMPDGDTSTLMEFPVIDSGTTFAQTSQDFKFAAAVAGFGMLMRDSTHKGNATFEGIHEIAQEGLGEDPRGRRAEFLTLLGKAKNLIKAEQTTRTHDPIK